VVAQEVWSLSSGPFGSESSLVFQPSNPYLVDTVVVPMQYLTDTPILLRVNVSFDLVVSHPIQPMIILMQYLDDTPLILRGDAFFYLGVSPWFSHILFNQRSCR
jgi:hypothetical protein